LAIMGTNVSGLSLVGMVCAALVSCLALVGEGQADLVAHWAIEEGSGSTTENMVPPADDPLQGDPTWVTSDLPPVPSGTTAALEFDGNGDFVDATSFAGVGGAGARTVAFWVKTTYAGIEPSPIVAWGNSATATQKWHVRLNNNEANGPMFAIRTESQGGFIIGETPLNDGKWHHVASVFPSDATPDIEDVLHYVDGRLEGVGNSQPAGVNTNITTGDHANVFIGKGFQVQDQGDRFFSGQVDEVRIYDHALDVTGVRDLVPEPATFALLASGLAGLIIRRRKS
jgi:hypothetical protein